ncbi:MAG: bifunctional DNA-formamidopyrimidine glycosylase/DNA-(apurinic or apyrimidinic site) lyase [Deltaproteobacteria bacterium]|nr:bifunctional DNA-formamidopyrimidine glycosylase/DNA-(apurinic or apyrimidinic site) lyase [Deltaproteobacteria bacterium]
METVRRTLSPRVEGRVAVDAWRSRLALHGQPPRGALLRRAVVGATFQAPQRRGKLLLLPTTAGGLLVHLGMSGRLTVTDAAAPAAPHTHLRITFSDGTQLRYVDARRFGQCQPFLGDALPPAWSQQGPDPLTRAFTEEVLAAALQGTRRAVKLALLDQALLAGLGNIYASEALWLARIHPATPAGALLRAQVTALHHAVVTVLTDGVRHGGTTLRDYVDARGGRGSHQDHLQAYGREGQPCARCGMPLRCSVLGQRSTFFCPVCQPSVHVGRQRRGKAARLLGR